MNKSLKIILSTTTTAVFLLSYPAEVLAKRSWVKNFLAFIGIKRNVRGKVGSRPKGGGGRGNCPSLASIGKDIQLIALIPEANISESKPDFSSLGTKKSSSKVVWSDTLKHRPSLWFYTPYKYEERTQVKFAKLALIDENKRLVTRPPFLFQLPKESGIVQVQIPINLEINQPYKWFFSVVCDENKPSRNPSVSGWIQKVSSNQAGFVLETSEETLTRIDYPYLAERGLWFDAFTRLTEVYQATIPATDINEDWLAVFQALELGDDQTTREVSQAPIFKLNCVSRTDGSKCD